MTTSPELVDLSVWVLKDVGTDAGAKVYSPGDWRTWDGNYPYVRVTCAQEQKTSLGRAAIEFDVVATIRFVARVEYLAGDNDAGAAQAEAALAVLRGQIERAVINHPKIMPHLSHYPFVRSLTGFSAEGEQHLAELMLDIGMEFYQGPEDFYQPRAFPLTDIRFATQLPDPAASNGALPGPVLDVQPTS